MHCWRFYGGNAWLRVSNAFVGEDLSSIAAQTTLICLIHMQC